MTTNNNDHFCWYEFWRCPWLHADPSWLEAPAWLADTLAMSRYHHKEIGKALGISEQPAPAPTTTLLEITPVQRQLSLNLAAELIAPGVARDSLNSNQLLWCRRTSAALRLKAPVERDKASIIGLASLRNWQSSAWSRLCWLYDRELVERANFLTLPPLKQKAQETLWQSVLWQVTNEQLNHEH